MKNKQKYYDLEVFTTVQEDAGEPLLVHPNEIKKKSFSDFALFSPSCVVCFTEHYVFFIFLSEKGMFV